MALFGKKNEEKNDQTSCSCGKQTGSEAVNSCSADGNINVKVLGSGCRSCHQLYDNAIKAVERMDIKVEYITDLQQIMEYGAMSMPALVVNETLVSSGKVLKPAEILKLLNR